VEGVGCRLVAGGGETGVNEVVVYVSSTAGAGEVLEERVREEPSALGWT
jgi:hypothetical protein